MNEAEVRKSFVNKAKEYLGYKESDSSHKKIIDGYNANKPLARDYKVKYTDSWCATFVSFVSIKSNFEDIIPTECSCQQMIELFKKLKCWQEDGKVTPEIGDIIFYNWDDKTQGNDGWSDHVGIVEKIVGKTITVIEGNFDNAVKRRNIQVGNGYIRGYAKPKYEKKVTVEKKEEKDASKKSSAIEVGDEVSFVGAKHYANSYAGAKSYSCKKGNAKVTAINKGAKYPYHLVSTKNSKSTVHGWVKASDIKADADKTTSTTIKVGDTVDFTGSKHYVSSYTGAKYSSCKPGKAKVTKINKNGKYKYHLVKTNGSRSTVSGWVKASDVSK